MIENHINIFALFLRRNWLIIVAALILAILIELPVAAFPYMAGSAYRGINIPTLGGGNVHEYLTRGHDILEGHGLGSSTLREGKDNQDYYFSISEYLLVLPVRFLDLDKAINIVIVYNIANFLGVFVLILLIYAFVLQLSGDRLLAASSALFVIGGHSILSNKHLFYVNFNIYGRAVYPYVASVFFFVYLNLLLKSLRSGKFKYTIFAALSLGFLFYIYFYAWTFILAFNAVLFLLLLLWKDFLRAKTIFFVSVTGLALGAYNLWRIFSFVTSPVMEKFAYFSLSVYTYVPVFSLLLTATSLIFLAFLYKRRGDANAPFMAALLLAGWASLNQQVLTGRIIQYDHYYWFFVVPSCIIIGFYVVWQLIRSEPLRRFLFVALIILVFTNTLGGQYLSIFTTLNTKLYEQNFKPIIDALNKESNAGVILSADETDETLFTIYTPHDLFWYSFALLDQTPIERAKDALFVYLYLNKESRNDPTNYIDKALNDKSNDSFYTSLYKNIDGFTGGKYKKVASGDASQVLKLLGVYGVSHIVWDKNKHPEWDLSFLKLKLLAANNNIYLYEVIY